jgi:hypothetical protein
MARIGIAITKSVAFRNGTQEFTNTYYYENGGALPDEAGAEALIDQAVSIEKGFHASTVSFIRGRCWSQIGTPAQNNMIHQKNLSGTGSATGDSSMDRERAFLFRWRAGNDSRGNPVYLRKWYHSCGQFGTASGVIGSSIHANTAGFSNAVRDAMEVLVAALVVLTPAGGNWSLVAKSGRTRDDTTPTAHQFLEHHQLGDQWRAA